MSQDYWNEAVEQEQGPKMYFGQIFTDSFPVRILKGQSKVLFDPASHPVDQRFIQVKIDGVCTKADGSTYTIAREMVVKLDAGWNITKASVKKLGTDDPNEKWARWEMVEDGRSWNSKTTGELVKGSAFKFAEFFDSEEACRAAEAIFYNRSRDETAGTGDEPLPMPPTEDEKAKERAGAAVFLSQFWTLAAGDLDAFYAAIANQPALSKFFDSNSPEVVAIVASGAA